MSLRRRLFFPVVTALLPIIAIEAYNQVQLRTAREQEIRDSSIEQARRVAAELQRIIDGAHNVLSTIVVLNSVRTQEAARCNGLFVAILPSFKGFESLVAARADGQPFCVARAANKNGRIDLPSVGKRRFRRKLSRLGAMHASRAMEPTSSILRCHTSIATNSPAGSFTSALV
jgi:hypothetical protein